MLNRLTQKYETSFGLDAVNEKKIPKASTEKVTEENWRTF